MKQKEKGEKKKEIERERVGKGYERKEMNRKGDEGKEREKKGDKREESREMVKKKLIRSEKIG
jgi:hypothetical protein